MSWQSPPPDPTNPDLLDNLRAYLISQGVVRDPRDGSNPNLPPLWLAPRFGVPSPGSTEGINPVEAHKDAVLGAFDATDIPPTRFEGFLRHAHVELVFRTRTAPMAKSLENSIRAAINDKRGWMMANMPVNESLLYRGFQPVGSDNLGYTYTEEYAFDLWGPFQSVGP